MHLGETLTQRFTKAIKKTLPKTPLIGPKWFKYFPKGRPVDFQFTGCGKLAKATKNNPKNMARMLLKNLQIKDLDLDVSVTADFRINVKRRGKAKPENTASEELPAEAEKE